MESSGLAGPGVYRIPAQSFFTDLPADVERRVIHPAMKKERRGMYL